MTEVQPTPPHTPPYASSLSAAFCTFSTIITQRRASGEDHFEYCIHQQCVFSPPPSPYYYTHAHSKLILTHSLSSCRWIGPQHPASVVSISCMLLPMLMCFIQDREAHGLIVLVVEAKVLDALTWRKTLNGYG